MNRISDSTFEDYYSQLFDKTKISIASEPEDYIVAQPTEDLVKYYSRNCLNPVEFNLEKEESLEHKKHIKTIYARERDYAFRNDGDLKIECENIVVKIPLIPNNDIAKIASLRTNQITISATPKFNMSRTEITIDIEIKGYGINLSNEEIKKWILATKEYVGNYFHSKNAEMNVQNLKFINQLSKFINERKEKLDADKKRINELTSLVKIPLV